MELVVHVYGDSLALPRPWEDVHIPDTYPELFSRALEAAGRADRVSLYNRSQGGVPIRNLRDSFRLDARYFAGEIDILVVHCGIVDCAPRPLRPLVRAAVGALPARLRYRVVAFIRRNRARILRAHLGSRLTPPRRFRTEICTWLSNATATARRVYLVNISPTTTDMEKRSPGLSRSIDLYNSILHEAATTAETQVSIIDVHGLFSSQNRPLTDFISDADGHHITRLGHRLLADMLLHRELESGD